MRARLPHEREKTPPVVVEPLAVVLQEQPAVAVDAAQRGLQVVGNRIREGLQLAVLRRQLRRAQLDALLEQRVERDHLLLRPLALRDVDAHAEQALDVAQHHAHAGEKIRDLAAVLRRETGLHRGLAVLEHPRDALRHPLLVPGRDEIQRPHARDLLRGIAADALEIAVPADEFPRRVVEIKNPGQAVYHRLRKVALVLHRLAQLVVALDVRGRAHPLDQPARLVAQRQHAQVEPAHQAVVPAQPRLRVEGLAAPERRPDARHQLLAILRRHLLQPAVAELLRLGPPGVVEPAPAQVVAAPVRSPGPHELGQKLRHAAETLLARAQLALRLQPLALRAQHRHAKPDQQRAGRHRRPQLLAVVARRQRTQSRLQVGVHRVRLALELVKRRAQLGLDAGRAGMRRRQGLQPFAESRRQRREAPRRLRVGGRQIPLHPPHRLPHQREALLAGVGRVGRARLLQVQKPLRQVQPRRPQLAHAGERLLRALGLPRQQRHEQHAGPRRAQDRPATPPHRGRAAHGAPGVVRPLGSSHGRPPAPTPDPKPNSSASRACSGPPKNPASASSHFFRRRRSDRRNANATRAPASSDATSIASAHSPVSG